MLILTVFIVSLVLPFAPATECPQTDKVVICYYGSWSVYREGIGQYTIDNINPSFCTHLVYTFAGLNIESKITSLDSWNDIDSAGYTKFTSLKDDNPCLKTLLAIGGWNEGSRKYSVMASSQESREAFVESVLRFIVAYNFDGIDFDWEYPGENGGISEDRENLAELLKLLKARLSKWDLLLTVAVPISITVANSAYDVEALSNYADYVFVMAYDYTPTTSDVTGLLAPLPSIQASVGFWLEKGLPKSKLVLGMPAYARSFELENEENYEIGVPVTGPGEAGTYTKESGFLSYYELQAKLSTGRYTIVPAESTYYAFGRGEWFSFDLSDSYTAKVKYVLDQGLAGVMVWSIDNDDFGAIYNETTYPVLTAINSALYSI